MKAKSVRGVFRRYLLLSMFINFGLSIVMATYVMFLKNHGLNAFEVNMVNFAFFTMLFFLELPTGAFADVYGRRASILLGCALESAGMLLYAIAPGFWGFVGAEIVAGLGRTFLNGAFQSWLVDTLNYYGYQKKTVNRLLGIERQAILLVILVSPLLGSYLDTIDPRLPWAFGAGVSFIAGILAFFLVEEVYRNPKAKRMGMCEKMGAGIATARKSTVARFIFLVGFVNCIGIQAINMFWQPLFAGLLPKGFLLGWVFSGISISLAVGYWIGPRKFEASENVPRLILSLIAFRGAFIVLVSQAKHPIFALAALYLYEIGVGAYIHIREVFLQTSIKNDAERATVVSLCAVPQHLGGMIGLFASGVLAEAVSLESAWLSSGVLLIFSAVLLWDYFDRSK